MPTYLKTYFELLDLPLNLKANELIELMIHRHISLFSFSSINVILNKPLSLEPEKLFERVVKRCSGGYCFEHNKIFYLALKHLGFDVRPLIGRVMLNNDPENGRSHRLTLLDLDNEHYIIDVGFGVMSPRGMLPLIEADNIILLHANYQIHKDERQTYRVIKTNEANPVTLYRLDLSEATEMDCEISHFYSHKNDNAAFVNHLVVSRIEKNTRYLIRNLTFSQFNDDKNLVTEKEISNPNTLKNLLQDKLYISISHEEAICLFNHQTAFLQSLALKAS